MVSLTATMGAQLIQTRQTQVHVGVACLMKTQMAMDLPSASTTVLMIPTIRGHCGCGVPETDVFGDLDCDGDYDIDDIRLGWPTLASKKLKRTPAPPMLMVTEALDSPMS